MLPIPDSGQQIQWSSNVQQLGRGANKIVLSGTAGSATIPGSVTATAAAAPQYRVAPATSGQESSIGFYRNSNLGVTNAGDVWVIGQSAWGVGAGNFAIGRHNSEALTITAAGAVNIPGSLTIGGIAAQRIPYVSCRVDGSNVNNRGGQVAPTADASQTGRTILTISPPHPAGGLFNPQVKLISNWGYIYVDSPFTGGSLSVWTANSSLSFATLSFFLLIF